MRENGGYSLVEVAVATMLIGLGLGMYLQHFTVRHERARYEVTQKRLEEVRTALTAYAAHKGRLPCPKSPESAISSPGRKSRNKKEEIAACEKGGDPPKGIIVFTPDKRAAEETAQVWTGALPVHELRLNDEQAYDGWGRLFTYAVSRGLTLPDSLKKNPLPPGVLTIEDAFGNSLLATPNTGRYTVVSHGATGQGGWSPGGGKRPCGKNVLDSKNCDGDSSFVSAPYAPAGGKVFFDDLIIFDDLDVGGTLLDRLVKCNAKMMFYLPGEEDADSDGCAGYKNVIKGACLIRMTLMPNGEFERSLPQVVMPPSVARGGECGCEPGYSTTELGTWDVKNLLVTDTMPEAGEAATEEEEKTIYVRSALYVCRK